MKLQEHCHQDGNNAIEHVGYLDDDVRDKLLLVALFGTEVVGIEGPLDALEPGKAHRDDHEVGDDEDIDEEEDEKFAVPKANAIVDPGAVVIHVQYASIARRAVMASLWLENVAHKAVASSFVLRVSQVESPEDGDLPRVCGHGLDEGPDEHEE